jgi:hypothetical protein
LNEIAPPRQRNRYPLSSIATSLMMKILLITLAIGFSVIGAPRMLWCFCITPTVSESFKNARAVFVGEVTDVIEPKIAGENTPDIDHAYTIEFKVHQRWKGLSPATTDFNILWTSHCYECPPLPHIKETYLVYAYPVAHNETLSFVGWCNRTIIIRKDAASNGPGPNWDMKQLNTVTKSAYSTARITNLGPQPRAASFASDVIRRSCLVAPWPGQLNRSVFSPES